MGGPLTGSQCDTCSSFDDLATFIDEEMPFGNADDCSGNCASDIASYILAEFSGHGGDEFGVAAAPGEEFNCEPNVIPPSSDNLVRRLTRGDYARTINGITGVDVSDLANSIPDLPPVDRSFNNNAIEITVGRLHITSFYDLAIEIAPRLANWLNEQITCTDFTEACETQLIEQLSLTLYRAPLETAERDALRSIFTAGMENNASFTESANYVLEAMLQGPRFIYRLEQEVGNGDIRQLNSYELASRLSYAIWGSAPDQQLLDAAANGVDEVLGEVDRMLNDSRAQAYGIEFLSDWFDLHRMANAQADSEKFEDFDNALFDDMEQETRQTFANVVNNQDPITSIYNVQETTVTEALARHYGLPSPQSGTATYDLSAVPERGGILTQGALHTIGGNESSTVRRGLFMLNQVICSVMASPPADVDTTPPDVEPGKSIRSISEDRVGNDNCGLCHSQFEPMVWGLVPFNAVGSFHIMDEFGNDLPEDGYLKLPGDDSEQQYSSVGELANALAQSGRTRDCAILKSFEFIMARAPLTSDSCAVSGARAELENSNGSYQDIVRAIVRSEKFRTLQTETN